RDTHRREADFPGDGACRPSAPAPCPHGGHFPGLGVGLPSSVPRRRPELDSANPRSPMNSPCSEALAAASAVASRLVDPSVIGSRGVASGGRGRRRPQSLAGGAAGIALLHIERAYT